MSTSLSHYQNAHQKSISQLNQEMSSNEIKKEVKSDKYNLSDQTEVDHNKKVLGLYSQHASAFLQNKEIPKYNHNLSYINLSYSLKNSQKKINGKIINNTNGKKQIFSDKSFTNGSSYNDEEYKMQQFILMNKNYNLMNPNYLKELNSRQSLDNKQQIGLKTVQKLSQNILNQESQQDIFQEDTKSDEENVSDESFIESKNQNQDNQLNLKDKIDTRLNQKIKGPDSGNLQNIQNQINVLSDKTNCAQANIQVLDCVLNQRKNNQIYSFSQNVDYDRLTLQQKKRFLTKNSNIISANQYNTQPLQKDLMIKQINIFQEKNQNLQIFNVIQDDKYQNPVQNIVDNDIKNISQNQLSIKKLKLNTVNKENQLAQKIQKKKIPLQTQRNNQKDENLILNKKIEKDKMQSPLSQMKKIQMIFKNEKVVEQSQPFQESTQKNNQYLSQEKNLKATQISEQKKDGSRIKTQNGTQVKKGMKSKNMIAAPLLIQYASLNSFNKENIVEQSQKNLNKNVKPQKKPELNQIRFQEISTNKIKENKSLSKLDVHKKSNKDEINSASLCKSKSNRNILPQKLDDIKKGKDEKIKTQLSKTEVCKIQKNGLMQSSRKSGSKQSFDFLKDSKQKEQQSINKSLGNKHCKTPKLSTYKPKISIDLIGQMQNDKKSRDSLRNLKQTNSQKQTKFKQSIHAYLSQSGSISPDTQTEKITQINSQNKQMQENFDSNLLEFNNMEIRQVQRQKNNNSSKQESRHLKREDNLNQIIENSTKIKSQISEKVDSQYMKYLSNSQDELNISNLNNEQVHRENIQKLQLGSPLQIIKSQIKNSSNQFVQRDQKLEDSENIPIKILKLDDLSIEVEVEKQSQLKTNQNLQDSSSASNYNKFLNQTPEAQVNQIKVSSKIYPLIESKLDYLSISKKNEKIKVLSHQKKQSNILQKLKLEKLKLQTQECKQKQTGEKKKEQKNILQESNEEDDFEIGQIPTESQSQPIGFTSSDEITQFNQNDCISCFESDLTHQIQNQYNIINGNALNNIGANKLPQKSEKKLISQSAMIYSKNYQAKNPISNECQKQNEQSKIRNYLNENQPINRKEILEIIESEENQETSFDALNQNQTQIDLSQIENAKDINSSLLAEKNEKKSNQKQQNDNQLEMKQNLKEAIKIQNEEKIQSEQKPEQHMLSCMCDECKDFDQLKSDSSIKNSLHNSNNNPHKYKYIIEDASNLIEYKINFHSIYEQKIILSQLKDLIEIRPSVIQQYSNIKSFCSNSSNNASQKEKNRTVQAIEGLSHDERVKIQQLCQEWWDCTQEDKSIFYMALSYQQNVQQSYFKSSIHEQNLSEQEKYFFNKQNSERSQCMRNFVILQSVVVGMTAFFSMLTKNAYAQQLQPGKNTGSFANSENNIRLDLELRQRISQLIKIIFDQFMLCQSYMIGKLSSFEKATVNNRSPDHKLYQSYCDHIHLLFINKKIQSENDYLIFNSRNTFPQYPKSSYIVNEENRDYQISQLSKRLKENIIKILDQEIEIQEQLENKGNVELLCILKDICIHSDEVDFQEGKNHIYQGISLSEVMPGNQSIHDNNDYINSIEVYEKANEAYILQMEESSQQLNKENDKNIELQKNEESQIYYQTNYGINLIKTFNNDANQIILEESREDSLSQINTSKMEQINQISQSLTRSKMNSRQLICSPVPAIIDIQEYTNSLTFNSKQDFQADFEKVLEIHESEESEQINDPLNSHLFKQL